MKVYIRVYVQKTWGPMHPLLDLTFKLKLEARFSNQNLLSWIKTDEIWHESDAT